MPKNWIVAYSTLNLQHAELAKQFLFDHGITAVVLNKKDSNYLFGHIELLVERDSLIKAKSTLKSFLSEGSNNA